MKTTLILFTFLIFQTSTVPFSELTNTSWSLISFSVNGETKFADKSCSTTLHFDSLARYDGYSGWNTFGGKYSVGANRQLTLDNPIRTKRGGETECKLGETLYGYFARVNKYVLKNDTLTLLTPSNEKIVYRRLKKYGFKIKE